MAAPLTPLAAPASQAAPAAPLGPLNVTVTVGSNRITVQGTSQARLVSVVSSASGKVRARFVFSPKGIKFHGTKTIVRGRDAAGHIVLTVMVRGDAKHGYQLRAVNGGKKSAWLKLKNKRVVLVAALSPGLRPKPDAGPLTEGGIPENPKRAESGDMQQQRPHLRTVAATYATGVVAATAAPPVPSDRTSAVVAICALAQSRRPPHFVAAAGEPALRRRVR